MSNEERYLEIFEAFKSGKIKTTKEAEEQLKRLAPPRQTGNLFCKVSPKGAISVYGLQQMPVTLYAEQWERLLAGAPKDHFVLKFIRDNEGKDYHGEWALEKGGKKVPYTARITRKAAVACPGPTFVDGPQCASASSAASTATACAVRPTAHTRDSKPFRRRLGPNSILRWLLAPIVRS
jgi:hypothetical protein